MTTNPIRLAAAVLAVALVGLSAPVKGAIADDGETEGIRLQFPLDCTLGEDCWLARYADRKKGVGKADFRCGRRTQNRHRGTDFTINDYAQMAKGVAVLAAADGTVTNIRDGMADEPASDENKEERAKKGCGNAVIIAHAGGYQTQYCHMKNGSVTVKEGDTVKKGSKIGEVGLSGDTEYPHLHFGLRRKGKNFDPFDGTQLNKGCNLPGESLWETNMPYEEFTLMPLTFSGEALTRQSRWEPQPESISAMSDFLVLTGRGWNLLAGDAWFFKVTRPDGKIASNRSIRIDENRQSNWYWAELTRPQGGFMPGVWKGELRVTRRDANGQLVHYEAETQIQVTPAN